MKEDAMPKRPWTVTTGVYLFYLSIGLWMIGLSLKWSKAGMSDSLGPEVGPLLTMALICYLSGRGRNWARIILLILFILGTPLALLSVIRSFGHSDFSGPFGAHSVYIEIIQISIQLAAVVLLFQRASSDWFRPIKNLKLLPLRE